MLRVFRGLTLSLLLAALLCGSSLAGTIVGKVKAPSAKKQKDVVVFIEKAEGSFKPTKKAVLDQVDFVFIPRVLPILVGTTVDFHNSDPVLHNVYSPDAVADKANLGTWPKGEVRSHTFKKLGIAAILCNVHPEMEAYIVVLQNPYFAVTDKSGAYKIENVPAGKYKLKTWSSKTKSQTVEVTVPASGEVTIDFNLK